VDRWRGKNLVLANLEYRRPVTDTLTGVAFVDIGSAWGGTFDTVVPGFTIKADDQGFEPHVGAGVGLRVDTPIGAIRLDMGWGEEGSEAHFSFGQTF
jgi:outer membrane protein insertion porin family